MQDALSVYFKGKAEDDEVSATGGALNASGPFKGSGPVTGTGSSSSAASSTKGKARSTKRFATLSDITSQDNSGGGGGGGDSPVHSGSEDDDENLFTGGEKSGLAVQNPDDMKASGSRLIDNIFRQAARPPPSEGGADDEPGPSRETSFRGTGFTLGSDSVPSQQIPGQEEPKPKKKVTRRLTFWKDGFSVEDGPLYRYDDPANVNHLQAINSGTAPLSLLQVEAGESVDVHIIRKMDENYTAPKPKPGGFQGQGMRLGSPVPGEVSTSPTPQQDPAQPPAASSHYGDGIPGVGDAIIMIRLADGRSFKVRFANSGLVQQIYDYINMHYPTDRDYVLQTTFPNKELRDRTSTIQDHKLKGSVVVQKWV